MEELSDYKYDYQEAVYNDVKNELLRLIKDFEIDIEKYSGRKDDLIEYLNDLFWANDSITGNGSGSYTFNTYLAECYLCHNYDLLREAYKELGMEPTIRNVDSAEDNDVTIRCYLLRWAIEQVVDDLIDEGILYSDDEDE